MLFATGAPVPYSGGTRYCVSLLPNTTCHLIRTPTVIYPIPKCSQSIGISTVPLPIHLMQPGLMLMYPLPVWCTGSSLALQSFYNRAAPYKSRLKPAGSRSTFRSSFLSIGGCQLLKVLLPKCWNCCFQATRSFIQQKAQEHKLARIIAGANVRSDLDAGETLGRLLHKSLLPCPWRQGRAAAVGNATILGTDETDAINRGEVPWITRSRQSVRACFSLRKVKSFYLIRLPWSLLSGLLLLHQHLLNNSKMNSQRSMNSVRINKGADQNHYISGPMGGYLYATRPLNYICCCWFCKPAFQRSKMARIWRYWEYVNDGCRHSLLGCKVYLL